MTGTGKKKTHTYRGTGEWGKTNGEAVGDRALTFDPGYFVVPAQDHNGHSVRVWCRVQPTVDHEIDKVVESKAFPFRVKGDFVRWCIWEGVKRIQKMKPVPGSLIVVAESIMATCKAKQNWLAFKNPPTSDTRSPAPPATSRCR